MSKIAGSGSGFICEIHTKFSWIRNTNTSTTCLILEYGLGEVCCLVRSCSLRLPVAAQPVGLQDGAELLPHLRLLRARLTTRTKGQQFKIFAASVKFVSPSNLKSDFTQF
jgi:hypothetical protein